MRFARGFAATLVGLLAASCSGGGSVGTGGGAGSGTDHASSSSGSGSTSGAGSTGTSRSTGRTGSTGGASSAGGTSGAGGTGGSTGTTASTGGNLCDTQSCVVYASSDHDLYQVDPADLTRTHLCSFGGALSGSNADVVTDIAVSADGTVYAITETALYTADPRTCAATRVATLSQAGTRWVGLTFTADGALLAADGSGALVRIDPSSGTVSPIGNFGGGLACSGDLVAIDDAHHTLYATATQGSGNDRLVTVDPATGTATRIGSGDLGYRSIFGLGFWAGTLYGFTHAGVTLQINPATGTATAIDTAHPAIAFSGGATTPLAPVFQ